MTYVDSQTLKAEQTRGYIHSQLAEPQQTTHPDIPLSSIAPHWHSVLARQPKTDKIRFKVRGKTVDISQMTSCIVGEAHQWNDDYDCDDCYKTSLEFATLLRDSPFKRKAQLDAFVTHFNSKHL